MRTIPALCLALFTTAAIGQPVAPLQLLKQRCSGCHIGKEAAGGFDVAKLTGNASFRQFPEAWTKAALRIHNGEMPPKSPLPVEEREAFKRAVDKSLRAEACATGAKARPAPFRRLNRDEYTATIRDLLNLHMNVGAVLPVESAGGEGFDNAAETLFLSPIHAEKYLEAAKMALNYASKDPRSRAKFLISTPDREGARAILEEFLPRAFRRPVDKTDVDFYLVLYETSLKRGESVENSLLYAMRAVLVSPQFLFRSEASNDDYALASRLSYFLWGTMPDSLLFALAETGQLRKPEVLDAQITRMLRNSKSTDFARRFVDQWLRTRDVGTAYKPDPALFPEWNDTEIQGDIRNQPVLFFREILANDLPVLDLLDSRWTIATRKLQRMWGTRIRPARPNNQEQPQRIELTPELNRGGLMGMPAVLMISSHPHRTSPVLRGKWLLDAILGTPPPPPPPGVPQLDENHNGAAPATLRERLAQHRANPACASCHDRIDPLGFALENFDVLGRWRSEDSGKPIDATGQLPDGTKFNGPAELKAALMDRKELFLRNFTNKLLGFALGRGLTLQDSCTVHGIMAEAEKSDYRSHALIRAVVTKGLIEVGK